MANSANLNKASKALDIDPGQPSELKIKGRGICLSILKLEEIIATVKGLTNEVGHTNISFDPPRFPKATHIGFIITKAVSGKRLTVDIFPLVGMEEPSVKIDFIIYGGEYGYSLSDGGGGPGIFRTPPPSIP
ncbi:MAG: hypothetical protein V4683_15590 [Bacteroidota bacterium]